MEIVIPLTFEEFKKLEIKVAKVKEVSDHPNADKLYVIKIDTFGDPAKCGVVLSVNTEDTPDKDRKTNPDASQSGYTKC